MAMVKTFDPKDVIITYGGVQLSGFADGTFITITFASDAFTKKVGADGEVARARTNDDTAEMTLTLMQTSESNSYLSTVSKADMLTGKGALPLSVKDLRGNSLFFFLYAWVKKIPDFSRGKEIGDTAWAFDTSQAVSAYNGGLA